MQSSAIDHIISRHTESTQQLKLKQSTADRIEGETDLPYNHSPNANHGLERDNLEQPGIDMCPQTIQKNRLYVKTRVEAAVG